MAYEGSLIVVKDAAVSRRFYENVLRCKSWLDLGAYVCYEGGFSLLEEKAWLEFNEKEPGTLSYRGNVAELYFEEENLDAFLEHFSSFPDIEILCPLKKYPWGQRALRFYDPDHHVVEVGDSMKGVMKACFLEGATDEDVRKKTMFPMEFIKKCRRELFD